MPPDDTLTSMRGCIGVSLVVAIGLIGCGPTLGVRGRLAEQARIDMRCDHLRRVLQITDDAFEVTGCGNLVEYGDSGTGDERAFHRITPAASVAMEDMQCDIDRLQSIDERFPTRRTFTGCGGRVSYDLHCAEGVGCHWQRDGDVVRAVITPAPVLQVSPPPIDTPVPPPPGAS
jgi:hypothetical protein